MKQNDGKIVRLVLFTENVYYMSFTSRDAKGIVENIEVLGNGYVHD
jgi:hypothetical protein